MGREGGRAGSSAMTAAAKEARRLGDGCSAAAGAKKEAEAGAAAGAHPNPPLLLACRRMGVAGSESPAFFFLELAREGRLPGDGAGAFAVCGAAVSGSMMHAISSVSFHVKPLGAEWLPAGLAMASKTISRNAASRAAQAARSGGAISAASHASANSKSDE